MVGVRMNIEELAFKDRRTLAQLNELVLLDIIEFLQNDRKQWINQFTQTHNGSIEIQKENKQLKDNWDKLKEYIQQFPAIKYSSFEKVDSIRLSGKLIREDYLLNKMLELENETANNCNDCKQYKGSDSND